MQDCLLNVAILTMTDERFGLEILFVCFWRDNPPVGQGLLIHEVSQSHTTHHSRLDSSGLVISSSQRPLPDNTHNRQTSVPPVRFEPTISSGERPQTYALDRAATGTRGLEILSVQNRVNKQVSTKVTVRNLQVISDEFSVYRFRAL
jgi:hypothetical protein